MSDGQTCDQQCAWTDQKGDDFVPCPNTCAQPAGHDGGHHCSDHGALG